MIKQPGVAADIQYRMSLTAELLLFARRAGTERSTVKILAEMARFLARSFSVDRVSVYVYEGDRLVPLVAEYATGDERPELWREFRALEDLDCYPITRLLVTGAESVFHRDPAEGFPAEVVQRFEIGSYLAVPLGGERMLGFVLVEGDPTVLVGLREDIVELCGFVGLAVQNAQALARETQRAAEAEALLEVAAVLSRHIELTPVLAAVARNGAAISGFERASIFLLDDSGRLVPTMSQFADGHTDQAAWERFRNHPHEIRAGRRVLESGEPLIVPDAAAVPDLVEPDWAEPFGLRSMVVLPLEAWGERFGVLVLDDRRQVAITDQQVRLAKGVAAQGAVAIGLARLLRAERSAVERLEQVDRLKTDFIAAVSHELRTPLTTIIGFSQVLMELVAEPEAKEFVSLIRRESTHLEQLISNLLEVSRLEAGLLSVGLEVVDVGAVVAEAVEVMRVIHPAVHITLRCGEDLVMEAGDSRRLRQVVLNLVENACKYGKGRVSVAAVSDGRLIRLSVEDDGPGIPAEKRHSIFERFRRLDDNYVSGAGIGLYLVHALVEAHAGTIRVEDGEELGGARFVVELPVGGSPLRPA